MSNVRNSLGHFAPGETVKVACQHCAKPFEVAASRIKYGRGKSCSPACQYAAMRESPRLRSVAFVCVGCGAQFARPASVVARHKGAGKFCTRHCRDANRIRENHPQFIGRPAHHRGPNWMAQKRKARRRDNHTCGHCRRPGEDVHHIRPFRLFTDYRVANALANLITLCRPCHRRADAAFQAAVVAHVAR